MSASPRASTASAVAGSLMRLVVISALRELRASGKIGDILANAPTSQRAGAKWRDRRLQRRRRHRQRVIRIATGMEYLQRDLATGRVHRIGDDAMLADLPRERE